VKMIEDREIRHKTLWRFFKSFVVAWLIILVCSTLIRGTANVIVHTNVSSPSFSFLKLFGYRTDYAYVWLNGIACP
jgi:hypothetical protein